MSVPKCRVKGGLVLVAVLCASCVRIGFEEHGHGQDLSALPDQLAQGEGLPGDASDLFISDQGRDGPLVSLDKGSVLDGPVSCLTGPGPLARWVFANSTVNAGKIVQVPDTSTRSPNVPLDATNVAISGAQAVFSSSKLVPVNASDRDKLVAALAAADAFTVTIRAATSKPAQYGHIFNLWPQFSLVQNQQHFGVAVTTGNSSSATFAHSFVFSTTVERFLAGGWDGKGKEAFGYSGLLKSSTNVGAFAPSTWSSLEMLIGSSGSSSPNPWQGKLRELVIYDRAVTEKELKCLDLQGSG